MMNPESSLDLVRASGSYRDPEGFVFFQDNRVFRALTKDGLASYHDFRQSPLSQWLEEENWITRTWEIDDQRLRVPLPRSSLRFWESLNRAEFPSSAIPMNGPLIC